MTSNKSQKSRVLLVCVWVWGFLVSPTPATATLIPPLDLEALTTQADLIIVGRVVDIQDEGPTTIQIQTTTLGGRSFSARLEVKNVLKGKTGERALSFTFALPDAPAGYAGTAVGEYGVFFLRKDERRVQVLDPYHPSVVAAPGAGLPGGSILDRVVAEVSKALASPASTPDVRLRAIMVLQTVRTPPATQALWEATQSPDVRARAWAVAALLQRNDASVLSKVKEVALSRRPEFDEGLVAMLGTSLPFIREPSAIPTLSDLLGAANVNIRRGAAAALRNTHDGAAIKPLTQALNDSDPEVQYQGVIGLAEITGAESEWSPAADTFEKSPQRYLDYWREWAKSRK